jgi:hypothetical protein
MCHVPRTIGTWSFEQEACDINWLVWHGIPLINRWRNLFKTKEKLKYVIVEIKNLGTKLKSGQNLTTKFNFSHN